jgi:hypothetical protein
MKKSQYEQFVMLNLFQHLIKSIGFKTLKQSMKLVQDKVHGDRIRLFQQPSIQIVLLVNPFLLRCNYS